MPDEELELLEECVEHLDALVGETGPGSRLWGESPSLAQDVRRRALALRERVDWCQCRLLGPGPRVEGRQAFVPLTRWRDGTGRVILHTKEGLLLRREAVGSDWQLVRPRCTGQEAAAYAREQGFRGRAPDVAPPWAS
jgi:hypothetical protein